jgi:hypothetical protein
MSFNDDNFQIIRNVLSEDHANFIAQELIIFENMMRLSNNVPDNVNISDGLADGWWWYGLPSTEALMVTLNPLVNEITGKDLVPTFSYYRHYRKGAELKKHMDRPSCEYVMTITLSVDETPWEIYLNDIPFTLNVGDAGFYKGRQVPHHRDVYEGDGQIQVFLSWVDKNGEYAEHAYDKRPLLSWMAHGCIQHGKISSK